MGGVVNAAEQFKEARFDDAQIKKVDVKIDNLGCSVAKVVFEIESDNPERDFAGILGLQRVHVSLVVKASKTRVVEL